MREPTVPPCRSTEAASIFHPDLLDSGLSHTHGHIQSLSASAWSKTRSTIRKMSDEGSVIIQVTKLLLHASERPEGTSLTERYDYARVKCGLQWSHKVTRPMSIAGLFALETLATDLREHIAADLRSSPGFMQAMQQYETSSPPDGSALTGMSNDSAASRKRIGKRRREAEQTFIQRHLGKDERARYVALSDDVAHLRKTKLRLSDIGFEVLRLSMALRLADERKPSLPKVSLLC